MQNTVHSGQKYKLCVNMHSRIVEWVVGLLVLELNFKETLRQCGLREMTTVVKDILDQS